MNMSVRLVMVLALSGFVFSLTSCGNDASNPLGLSACQQNNTAEINFENRSTTNKSYDVIWDGSRIVSNLAPGQTSQTFTEGAGSHTVLFRVAGSQTTACSQASPNLAQCSGQTISCSN